MRRKTSAMLLDVAADYVAHGEGTGHKRQLLNGAVSAWNIACLPAARRNSAFRKFIREYRRMNSAQTRQDYCDVEEDM